MKKIIFPLIALFVMSAFALQAQVEKGKLFVSGALELNSSGRKIKTTNAPDTKYSRFEFELQPKVGYTVIDNMPVGLYIDAWFERDKDKDDSDLDREYEFSVGPFIRYYFYDFHGLKPFAEGSFGIGKYGEDWKSGDADDWEKYKESYFTFKMGGGLSYFFNDYVAADLFLGFNYKNYTHKEDYSPDRSEIKTKYIYNGFLMQMGIVVMLPLQE